MPQMFANYSSSTKGNRLENYIFPTKESKSTSTKENSKSFPPKRQNFTVNFSAKIKICTFDVFLHNSLALIEGLLYSLLEMDKRYAIVQRNEWKNTTLWTALYVVDV